LRCAHRWASAIRMQLLAKDSKAFNAATAASSEPFDVEDTYRKYEKITSFRLIHQKIVPIQLI
jgi:hypothetical protein